MSVSAACGRDPLAGVDRAGQRDHVDLGVGDERLPGRVAVAGDHVEHAGGEDLGAELGQLQRRQRRRLGRLEDDRVAGRQRRPDLPHRHHQRVVPRGDLADHADRLAPDDRGVAAHVLAGRTALEASRRPGEEAQVVDHERDLVVAEGVDRLAGVVGLDLGELVRVLFDRVSELEKTERALAGGCRRPAGEGLAGGLHRLIHVSRGGDRSVRDHLARGRVEDRLRSGRRPDRAARSR